MLNELIHIVFLRLGMDSSPKVSVFSSILGMIACLLIFSTPVMAEETDWMEFEAGFTEDKLGVELREIKQLDTASGQRILLAVPKTSIQDPNEMEEVVVIGYPQKKGQKEKVLKATFEWNDALDKDHYGLYINIDNKLILPIRLYFKADHSLDIDP